MLRILSILALFILSTNFIAAQSNQIGIDLAKAQKLYDQGIYDEAVRACNKILKADEGHTPTIFLRAQTKFQLGAYKGTKNDGLLYMEYAGATKEIIKLMAIAEYKMGRYAAAEGYVNTALELDPYDANIHFLAGEVAIEIGERNDACEAYARGAILGSSKAERAAYKICGGISEWIDLTPKTKTPPANTEDEKEKDDAFKTDDSDKVEEKEDDATDPFDMIEDGEKEVEETKKETEDGTKLDDIISDSTTKVENKTDEKAEDQKPSDVQPTDINLGGLKQDKPKKEEPPKNTNELPEIDYKASQDIVIDESITISINNGLGGRKLNSKPNIFMLSDQDGVVVIDICVDASGRVVEAEFNRDASTIFRSSLTSLSLRKTKQFTFLPSKRKEQCGSLVYRIKA